MRYYTGLCGTGHLCTRSVNVNTRPFKLIPARINIIIKRVRRTVGLLDETLGPGASGQRSLASVWERVCTEQTPPALRLFSFSLLLLLCAEGALKLQRETHLGAEMIYPTRHFFHCLHSLQMGFLLPEPEWDSKWAGALSSIAYCT